MASSKKVNQDPSALIDDLWSRIRIVNCVRESSKIVSEILKSGKPVAVDVEGLNLPRLGLVQIKTWDGQIFLFRTGNNPEILRSGGLKELFESPDIVKVFHASTSDCQGIYKEGIQMWNIYDTALAHKVIQYQNEGISIVRSPTISFSGLCEVYGLEDNPLKNQLGNSLYLKEELFLRDKPLPSKVILYSAADVDPLLDIYAINETLIEQDYLPTFQELCENELLRSVDPGLVKRRQNQRRRDESCTIFLKDLDKSIHKLKLYQILSTSRVVSKIVTSNTNRSAHVTFNNPQFVKEFYKSQYLEQFGPSCKMQLVNEIES